MCLFYKNHRFTGGQSGFSVLEMMVALSLFSMIAVVALSSVLALVNANEKTRNTKSTLDNLGFSVEEITRTLRFSQNFYCQPVSGATISLTSGSPRSECPAGGSYIAFEDRLGYINLYYYSSADKCIMKKTTTVKWGQTTFTDVLPPTAGHGYTCISSDDVEITKLKFHVHSWTIDSQIQRVTIVIGGYVGESPTTQSSFNLMTSVASRKVPIDY